MWVLKGKKGVLFLFFSYDISLLFLLEFKEMQVLVPWYSLKTH